MFLKFKYLIQYVILLFKENPERTTVTLHFQFHAAAKFFFVFLFSGINGEGSCEKDISTLTTPFILSDPHP